MLINNIQGYKELLFEEQERLITKPNESVNEYNGIVHRYKNLF